MEESHRTFEVKPLPAALEERIETQSLFFAAAG